MMRSRDQKKAIQVQRESRSERAARKATAGERNDSGTTVSGTGPTREQLSTRAGGRRCARSPLSASTRSFQLAGVGGGCAVATWLDNLDVEGGKGDLVGRRVYREKLRQPST